MSRLLSQERDLKGPNRVVVSPWRIPIPLEGYATSPVVVYFYSDRWIPITCFSLAEAIALYRKALFLGKEILVYPPDVDPSKSRLTEKRLEVAPSHRWFRKFSRLANPMKPWLRACSFQERKLTIFPIGIHLDLSDEKLTLFYFTLWIKSNFTERCIIFSC